MHHLDLPTRSNVSSKHRCYTVQVKMNLHSENAYHEQFYNTISSCSRAGASQMSIGNLPEISRFVKLIITWHHSGISDGASDKVNQNVEPCPGMLCTPTLPPCCSIIILLICRPRPRPTPEPLLTVMVGTR